MPGPCSSCAALPSDAAASPDVLAEFAQLAILLRRQQTRQVIVQRPHRWGDRHLVVVQDHDQLQAHCAGVVHRLVGHTRRHRAVADHRDHVAVLLTLQVAARKPNRRIEVEECAAPNRSYSLSERLVKPDRPPWRSVWIGPASPSGSCADNAVTYVQIKMSRGVSNTW